MKKIYIIISTIVKVLKLFTSIKIERAAGNHYFLTYVNRFKSSKNYTLSFDEASAISLYHETSNRISTYNIKSLDISFNDDENDAVVYIPCWLNKEIKLQLERHFSDTYLINKTKSSL